MSITEKTQKGITENTEERDLTEIVEELNKKFNMLQNLIKSVLLTNDTEIKRMLSEIDAKVSSIAAEPKQKKRLS